MTWRHRLEVVALFGIIIALLIAVAACNTPTEPELCTLHLIAANGDTISIERFNEGPPLNNLLYVGEWWMTCE